MQEMPKTALVTAGNTRVPIDQVRGIDNIFKGRTGVAIAEHFADHGCKVTLLTSHPDLATPRPGLIIRRFRSFDELDTMMGTLVQLETFDVIIHSAAVSDYRVAGTYEQTSEPVKVDDYQLLELHQLDSSGKIGSNYPELWLKMVPTIKIVDQIRQPWGFKGLLVKFKLQVGMADDELIKVATRSMEHSGANFVVANTLDELYSVFIIGAKSEEIVRVRRDNLPEALYRMLGI